MVFPVGCNARTVTSCQLIVVLACCNSGTFQPRDRLNHFYSCVERRLGGLDRRRFVDRLRAEGALLRDLLERLGHVQTPGRRTRFDFALLISFMRFIVAASMCSIKTLRMVAKFAGKASGSCFAISASFDLYEIEDASAFVAAASLAGADLDGSFAVATCAQY